MNRLTAIIGVIVVAGLLFFAGQFFRVKNQRDDAIKVAQLQKQKTKKWRDQFGLARGEVRSITADKKTLEEVYEKELKSKEEEIKGLKTKNLSSITNVSTSTSDTIEVEVERVVKDTVTNEEEINFAFEDRWTKINGSVIQNDLFLTYSVRDSLSFTSYYENKWFKKPELVLHGISYNPKTTIDNLQEIKVSLPPKKKWIMGPQAGVTYIDGTVQPYVGIGITFRLISF